MKPSVILTRPAHRNTGLAKQLGDEGCMVLSLPALGLAPLAVEASQIPQASGFDILVFVSSYASEVYLQLLRSSEIGPTWPEHTLAATVGQASAAPLYDAAFIPDTAIVHPHVGMHRQDSEGLWEVLQPCLPRLKNVLVLRGQTGREWLGSQFEHAGAQVTRFSLYQRKPAVWSGADAWAMTQALQGPCNPVFLLTSSESVEAVYANILRLGLTDAWVRCSFVVIHERICARLQSILQASDLCAKPSITICAPTDDAIYQAIRSSMSRSESL